MKFFPWIMILLILTIIWVIYVACVLDHHSRRTDWNQRMKRHQRLIIFSGFPIFVGTWIVATA